MTRRQLAAGWEEAGAAGRIAAAIFVSKHHSPLPSCHCESQGARLYAGRFFGRGLVRISLLRAKNIRCTLILGYYLYLCMIYTRKRNDCGRMRNLDKTNNNKIFYTMQSKGAIKLLAVLLALACIFQLSFTFVTNRVEIGRAHV